jgi:hypothetical protein
LTFPAAFLPFPDRFLTLPAALSALPAVYLPSLLYILAFLRVFSLRLKIFFIPCLFTLCVMI